MPLQPGDTLRLLEGRAPVATARPMSGRSSRCVDDVRCGFVARPGRAPDYGVALRRRSLRRRGGDRRLRKALAAAASRDHFGHGAGRVGFESVWTRPRYALLTRILREVPVAWRFFVKHQLFKALEGRAAGPDGGTAEVLEAYAALATRFADLPAPSIVVNETRAPEETRVTA